MATVSNLPVLKKICDACRAGRVAFVTCHNSNGWRNQHGSHYAMMRALDRRFGIVGTGVIPGSPLGMNSKGKLYVWQPDMSGNVASYNKTPPSPFNDLVASAPGGALASYSQHSAGVIKCTPATRNYVNANHVVDIAGTDITGSGWSGGAKTDATVLTSPAATNTEFYISGTTSSPTSTGTYQASRNLIGGWMQTGMYVPSGTSIGATSWSSTVLDSTMQAVNNLRTSQVVYRVRYGAFSVGTTAPSPYDILPVLRDLGGGTQSYLRIAGGVGTSNGTSSPAYLSLASANNSAMTYEQVFPPLARTGDVQMRVNYSGDHAINGPLWLGSAQVWLDSASTGCTETQALSFGGGSMTDIADLLTNTVKTSWIAELLKEAVQPAVWAGFRPVVVVRVCETLNQRNSTAASIPGGITPGDSAAAWYDSAAQVMKRWREGWAATGIDGDLYFLQHRDHRVSETAEDDAEMAAFQEKLEQLCVDFADDTAQVNPAGYRRWMNPQEIDSLSTISGMSVANPTTVTVNATHVLTTDDLVMLRDVTGVTAPGQAINDCYFPVTVTGAATFTIPLNVTASSSPTGYVYYLNAGSGAHMTILGYEVMYDAMLGVLEAAVDAYEAGLITGEESGGGGLALRERARP